MKMKKNLSAGGGGGYSRQFSHTYKFSPSLTQQKRFAYKNLTGIHNAKTSEVVTIDFKLAIPRGGR
jgi:hypothetical protein